LEGDNPTAPSASQQVGTTGFTALALGVQETGSSTSLAAGSSPASSSPAAAVSNVVSAGTTPSSTSNGSGSTGPSTTTGNRDHGRHSLATKERFATTDEAVADFDLADLWA
jgi:hypothetical protein